MERTEARASRERRYEREHRICKGKLWLNVRVEDTITRGYTGTVLYVITTEEV